MKNKIGNLGDHLFEQLERLGNEDLTAENLALEVDRSKAMVGVAEQLVEVGKLGLRAQELRIDAGLGPSKVGVLGIGEDL